MKDRKAKHDQPEAIAESSGPDGEPGVDAKGIVERAASRAASKALLGDEDELSESRRLGAEAAARQFLADEGEVDEDRVKAMIDSASNVARFIELCARRYIEEQLTSKVGQLTEDAFPWATEAERAALDEAIVAAVIRAIGSIAERD